MLIFETNRNKVAAFSAATLLALGGCASSEATPSTNSNDGTLSDIHFIGGAKDGYINAMNPAETATVYSADTLQSIGTIAHNQAFEIICTDTKPNSFNVELANGTTGSVNLDSELAIRVQTGDANAVPSC